MSDLRVSLYSMGLVFPVVEGSDVHKKTSSYQCTAPNLFNLNLYIFLLCLNAKVVKMTRSYKEI